MFFSLGLMPRYLSKYRNWGVFLPGPPPGRNSQDNAQACPVCCWCLLSLVMHFLTYTSPVHAVTQSAVATTALFWIFSRTHCFYNVSGETKILLWSHAFHLAVISPGNETMCISLNTSHWCFVVSNPQQGFAVLLLPSWAASRKIVTWAWTPWMFFPLLQALYFPKQGRDDSTSFVQLGELCVWCWG